MPYRPRPTYRPLDRPKAVTDIVNADYARHMCAAWSAFVDAVTTAAAVANGRRAEREARQLVAALQTERSAILAEVNAARSTVPRPSDRFRPSVRPSRWDPSALVVTSYRTVRWGMDDRQQLTVDRRPFYGPSRPWLLAAVDRPDTPVLSADGSETEPLARRGRDRSRSRSEVHRSTPVLYSAIGRWTRMEPGKRPHVLGPTELAAGPSYGGMPILAGVPSITWSPREILLTRVAQPSQRRECLSCGEPWKRVYGGRWVRGCDCHYSDTADRPPHVTSWSIVGGTVPVRTIAVGERSAVPTVADRTCSECGAVFVEPARRGRPSTRCRPCRLARR